MTKFLNISTDNTLGGSSASDVLVSSQKAIKDYVDQHGGGGSVAIDGSTITKNSSDEIQAVATINANAATGATNPLYDWVGTLAEYTSQAVATNHPDWVCYITDDTEATAYQAYTQSQCNNLFVQKGHQVIEFQAPTSANNYTWYRKYADGWVEQGGQIATNTTSVTFPVIMSDSNYCINICTIINNNTNTPTWETLGARTVSTTGMTVSAFGSILRRWQVSGMAA